MLKLNNKPWTRLPRLPFRKGILLVVLIHAVPFVVPAELQMWTLGDGTTFEAELVTVFSTEATFKNARGKVRKVPLDRFSEDARTRIELERPPRLSFEFLKGRDGKIFPQGISELTQRPPEVRCHYGMRIKQASSGNYNHELYLELFVVGRERLGDKFILLDHQNASFFLTRENEKEFEFRSEREVVLQNYTVVGSARGEKYQGYLAIVKDARGKVIAVDTSHNWLNENIENLRKRHVGNYMDDTCTRVFPTRPPVAVF